MRKYCIILLLFFPIYFTGAQDFKQTGTLDELINNAPSGYHFMDSTVGDLNRDSYPDLVLIYEKIPDTVDGFTIDDIGSRPLLLYTGQSDGKLKLVAWNFRTVLCSDCGGVFGDPFQNVVIKNGYFTVEHYGGSTWRWTRYITYKYNKEKENWYLHMDASDSYHVFEPENVSEYRATEKDFGEIPFDAFDLDEEY